MKKIILGISLLAVTYSSEAQLGGVLDRAKKKAEDKINKKADKEIDKKTDGDTGNKTESNESAGEKSGETSSDKNAETTGTASVKAYSKFDFVPGERIVVLENFQQDAVGDFPDKWNTTSSAEVVTLDGHPGKWLMFNKNGVFLPEFIDSLPDNFTFEYDLVFNDPAKVNFFSTILSDIKNRDQLLGWGASSNNYYFSMYPPSRVSNSDRRKDGTGEASVSVATKQLTGRNKNLHVAVWRQKERVRVYFNEEKVWDIPKAISKNAKLTSVLFNVRDPDDSPYYISNLRLAVGAPDTRNKLLTEGKWVTHGILFDVNSATIKGESNGTLREIANVLKENADVKVKIIGHTDSDGDDKSNMELSKRRAASVKEALAKDFEIDEARMQTDGMGESKPIDKNDKPIGKANNRRVEFVKM